MPSGAYYSENDPKAAATLRQLIKDGHIAPGDVDERSIEDVTPNELLGYTQVHLFAGFGIWSLAFRWGGIVDSESAWSCSCPCQPFSAAGKGAGFADERHLWPAAFHLISNAKRPDVPIYGEQVASSRVMPWIDLVWNDMEATGHTFRPVVLASAGFGAPIIRQRTFWVAVAPSSGCRTGLRDSEPRELRGDVASDSIGSFRMDESIREGLEGLPRDGDGGDESRWVGEVEAGSVTEASDARGMAIGDGRISGNRELQRSGKYGLEPKDCVIGELEGGRHAGRMAVSGNGFIQKPRRGSHRRDGIRPASSEHSGTTGPGPTNGFWSNPDWILCRDDKWRPVESGTFPLVVGYPDRISALRLCGNAISPQAASNFVRAHREAALEVEGVI